MSVDLSRRQFLSASAALGGGLLIGFRTGAAHAAEGAAGAAFTPNAFIRIGADGQIVLTMPYVEMGQGTYTSIPMLIAEELEVDLKQVRLEHAPPNEKLYGNPLLGGIQATGNSNAIRASWQPLRQAGATARTMLVSAAAKRWNVDPASCRAQSGEVRHAPTGRRLKYGELAAEAASMPVPESVVLKRPGEFKLIGTPARRLDTPSKVNGTAVYGIDARPPGVKIATLAQSPVFGGRVKSVDDSKAKAVKAVRQIVRLDDAVAVVADHAGVGDADLRAQHVRELLGLVRGDVEAVLDVVADDLLARGVRITAKDADFRGRLIAAGAHDPAAVDALRRQLADECVAFRVIAED